MQVGAKSDQKVMKSVMLYAGVTKSDQKVMKGANGTCRLWPKVIKK